MNKKILLLISFIFISNYSFSGILGPNSYEECVLEKKEMNLQVKESLCRKQFPFLKKLSKGSKAELNCVFLDDPVEGITFELDPKTRKTHFKTMDITIETITDEYINYSVNDKKVIDKGRLNLLTGELQYRLYKEGKNYSSHILKCTEVK